jgi:hypothetical protein
MPLFLALSPISHNPFIVFISALPLLARIPFLAPAIPVLTLVSSSLYSVFALFSRRNVDRIYYIVLGWMILLNILDVGTTWVGASFSVEGIQAIELNSFIRALFPEGSGMVGLFAMLVLKIAFPLVVLQPLYALEVEVIKKNRRFALLSRRQRRAERKVFNSYIRLHVGRWRESLFSKHGTYSAEVDDAYLDHAGSALLSEVTGGVAGVTILYIGILLNNFTVLLFPLTTGLGFIWFGITALALVLYFTFIQEKLVKRIYKKIYR